jgi:serpin B
MVQWLAQIKPATCLVALPKFSIEPKSVSLKPLLQGLGMHTVFGNLADFTPMLGAKGKELVLDDVYQAAGITIDESGGEAVAATAVVAVSKAFKSPQVTPNCVINRPFLFAIVHRASAVPVVMGKVVNPTVK